MDGIPMNSAARRSRQLADSLQKQEALRAAYWKRKDRFLPQRLEWRARMVRHLFHLLPGESILEVGCGSLEWTQEISRSNGGRNPICAATFNGAGGASSTVPHIETVHLDAFPGELAGRRFDFIVGWNLLTQENCAPFLKEAKQLLNPGGQILLFDWNPWNPYYVLRRGLARLFPFLRKDDRAGRPINRIDLFTILSEVGYVGIKILPYDFVFPLIPRFLLWPMQNLSLIFENFPYFRNFAGSLYLNAQKPPHEGWMRSRTDLTVHDGFKNRVSVVVPCHNEEDNVSALVENLKACYGEYLREVILVDDNSTDDTAKVVEALGREDARIRLVKRSQPNGVGRALRDGFEAVRGDYVLMMDCDFQHILPELTGLFDAVAAGADVAIGSRFSRKSVLLNYAFTKILANRGFHILANLALGRHFRDATNNLKLMRKEVLDKIRIESDDFAANAETGLQPIILGYKVCEVPISWINRSVDMGFSSFSLLKTGPNYLRVLFRLIWRKWFRKEIVPQPAGK